MTGSSSDNFVSAFRIITSNSTKKRTPKSKKHKTRSWYYFGFSLIYSKLELNWFCLLKVRGVPSFLAYILHETRLSPHLNYRNIIFLVFDTPGKWLSHVLGPSSSSIYHNISIYLAIVVVLDCLHPNFGFLTSTLEYQCTFFSVCKKWIWTQTKIRI